MEITINDPLLEQSLYQELFEMCVKEYFLPCESSNEESVDDVLSADELNVMRYVGGYVIRKLLKCYEKKSGVVYSQYTTCLGEMAVSDLGEGDDVLSYTRRWMDQVNRGGLFPLNDSSFHLFIAIEKCVRTYLPKHLTKLQSNIENFKKKCV